jgi:DNA-binding transcriptional MerR regulator
MNNVKSNFSIKDLENLSGIKAHTIRIWEKRYNLFHPNRTDTNIRYYDIENLQKLLNITFLYNNGYKISKISQLGEDKIPNLVRNLVSEQNDNGHVLNSFKMAMMNFDQALFSATYNALLKKKSFREIFYTYFIPFLNQIGLLWQTDTITPSHEHFICALIKQKILVNTEKLQNNAPSNTSKTFVLYLPDNEIHELGLMFLHYEILLKGYQAIFLGPSIPMYSLRDFLSLYDQVIFVSNFTVQPDKENIRGYLQDFYDSLLKGTTSELWISGNMLQEVNQKELPKSIFTFSRIDQLVQIL